MRADGQIYGSPSPFSLLPNELVDLIVRYLGTADLRALYLTHKPFVPFARPRLFSRLVISSRSQIEAVIAWPEAKRPDMLSFVKELRVTKVHLSSGIRNDLLSQDLLARLLDLTPQIGYLGLCNWTSAKVCREVIQSLGRLTQLKTLRIDIAPSDSFLWTTPFARLLRALPPRHCLHTLASRTAFRLREMELPQHITVDQLMLPDLSVSYWAPEAAVAKTFTQSAFSHLRALCVPTFSLSPSLLRSVAGTLEAMTINGRPSPGCLEVSAPRLVALCCFGRRGFSMPPEIYPLFERVRIIVAPSLLDFDLWNSEDLVGTLPALDTIYAELSSALDDLWTVGLRRARPHGRATYFERPVPYTLGSVDLLSTLELGRLELTQWR